MRLQGVEATFPFVRDGRASTATITADECLYQPQPQEASFRGNVQVRTDDGLELDTERLDYKADEGRGPDRRRRRASGEARARAAPAGSTTGRREASLDLKADVKLRLEDEAGPPTEIEAGAARATRDERRVRLRRRALVRQGARELRSERLQLFFNARDRAIERAAAIDDVDLRVGAGRADARRAPRPRGARSACAAASCRCSSGPGASCGSDGGQPGQLEVLPGRRDAPERRRLETRPASTSCSTSKGGSTSLEAYGGRSHGPQDRAHHRAARRPPGPPRRVESQSLVADTRPALGRRPRGHVPENVAFTEPGRQGLGRAGASTTREAAA